MKNKGTIYILLILTLGAAVADLKIMEPYFSPLLSILLCSYLIRDKVFDKRKPVRNSAGSCENWENVKDVSVIDNYISTLNLKDDNRALSVLVRFALPEHYSKNPKEYPSKAVKEELAVRLDRMIRKCDLFGKKGSSEFLVIFGSIDNQNTAETIAIRLMRNLTEEFIHKDKAFPVQVNVALVPISEKESSRTILSKSDEAMIEAESMGVNTFVISGMEGSDDQNRKTRIEIALKTALKNNEMEVYLQPKFTARNRELASVEALIRWTHHEMGNISPQEFIPIAENIGLIGEISRFVYYHSFELLRKLEEIGYTKLRLSLNVSPVEIHDCTLIKNLTNGLFFTGIDPRKIDLEITEGFLLTNSQSAINMLDELKLLGFNISIDDFGTGYSSLGYLKNFNFDTLKIDKSFIDHIQSDLSSRAIVKAIIALSQALELKTVAEGVEEVEQYEILRELGCDLLQGYYFGKPMSFGEFVQFLQDELDLEPKLMQEEEISTC